MQTEENVRCAAMEIKYRLMTIEDYKQAYDLWILCGNGLNDKDDSEEGIDSWCDTMWS